MEMEKESYVRPKLPSVQAHILFFFIFLYYLTGCLCHHNIMDDVTLAQ